MKEGLKMVHLKAKSLFCAVIFLSLVVLSGCTGGKDISVRIESDTMLTVLRGKVLNLELKSNPTTGYSWEIAGFAGSDFLARMGKYDYKPDSDRIGSGGIQIFSFKTKEKGDAKVIFEYRRAWEEHIEPAERYTVKVTVR